MPKRSPLDTAAFADAAVPRPDPVAQALAPVPTPPPASRGQGGQSADWRTLSTRKSAAASRRSPPPRTA